MLFKMTTMTLKNGGRSFLTIFLPRRCSLCFFPKTLNTKIRMVNSQLYLVPGMGEIMRSVNKDNEMRRYCSVWYEISVYTR